jgi:prepilin-type N-terminal cleavage/methylation domain-containing protein
MKKAFTLVELVISIVIIAIASVTLPMMLASANKLQEQTINQDIFFKSITVMTDILSKPWDDSSTIVGNEPPLIWNTQNAATDATLTNTTNGRYRSGSLQNYNYRYFYEPYLNATAISANATQLTNTTQIPSIGNYDGRFISESLTDGANVNYAISVRYVPDVAIKDASGKRETATWALSGTTNTFTDATDSTNLKRINIQATRNMGSETMNANFVYFSSNIGTPDIKKK